MIQWQSLESSLHEAMADVENCQLARSILGTDQVKAIVDLLQSFCQAQFGVPIAQCGLSYLSVGATFVVALTNGREIVIKASGRDKSTAALQAAAQIQRALAEEGFPCPHILTPPQIWQSTTLSSQVYVDPGDRTDGFAASVRTAMAHCLANLIQRTKRYTGLSAALPCWMPWLQDGSILWPRPHNVLFNFEQTAAGAEWIDQIAQVAQQRLLSANGTWVIGHSD